MVSSGANVLPQAVVEEAFSSQYGRTLNFRDFQKALGKLNSWCAVLQNKFGNPSRSCDVCTIDCFVCTKLLAEDCISVDAETVKTTDGQETPILLSCAGMRTAGCLGR